MPDSDPTAPDSGDFDPRRRTGTGFYSNEDPEAQERGKGRRRLSQAGGVVAEAVSLPIRSGVGLARRLSARASGRMLDAQGNEVPSHRTRDALGRTRSQIDRLAQRARGLSIGSQGSSPSSPVPQESGFQVRRVGEAPIFPTTPSSTPSQAPLSAPSQAEPPRTPTRATTFEAEQIGTSLTSPQFDPSSDSRPHTPLVVVNRASDESLNNPVAPAANFSRQQVPLLSDPPPGRQRSDRAQAGGYQPPPTAGQSKAPKKGQTM